MIWIILLITLVIIGNFIWLLPPRSERRRMKLRNKAILSGLTCREIRDTECLPTRVTLEEGPWLEYAIVHVTEDDFVTAFVEKAPDGQWCETDRIESGLLSSLPASIVRVTFRASSIGVLWNEQGELEDVAAIIKFLKSMSE
jgi:hypothetical protein